MNRDDKIINHVRNVKLLQAIHGNKKFYVECYPTDKGAKQFPNSNFAVKEIELPDFDLFEEKRGFRWVNEYHILHFAEWVTHNASFICGEWVMNNGRTPLTMYDLYQNFLTTLNEHG